MAFRGPTIPSSVPHGLVGKDHTGKSWETGRGTSPAAPLFRNWGARNRGSARDVRPLLPSYPASGSGLPLLEYPTPGPASKWGVDFGYYFWCSQKFLQEDQLHNPLVPLLSSWGFLSFWKRACFSCRPRPVCPLSLPAVPPNPSSFSGQVFYVRQASCLVGEPRSLCLWVWSWGGASQGPRRSLGENWVSEMLEIAGLAPALGLS